MSISVAQAKVTLEYEYAIERCFLTVTANDTLADVLSLMTGSTSRRVSSKASPEERHPCSGCVFVLEDHRFAGMLTEQDIVRLAASGLLDRFAPVRQVMTRDVPTLCETDRPDAAAVAAILRQHDDIIYLPVVDAAGMPTGLLLAENLRAVWPGGIDPVRGLNREVGTANCDGTSGLAVANGISASGSTGADAIAQLTADLAAANQTIFRERTLAQVTLQSIGDAVITTDSVGRILALNPLAEQYTGWKTEDVRDRPISNVYVVLDEETLQPLACPVEEAIRRGSTVRSEHAALLQTRDGGELAIDSTAAPIRDRDGTLISVVLVFRDVTESRQLSRQLSYQARHDDLTGLLNRREFERQLEDAIDTAREEDLTHVLCYMDLDQFKIVNDTCGHGAGDELLKQLADLLRQQVRTSDVLARLGGDEFGLLLLQCPFDRARHIAEELRDLIAEFRFSWQDRTFTVGTSIGLVTIDAHTQALAHVLGAADAACYAAKDKGSNFIQVYQSDDVDLARQRGERQWVARIKQALVEDRFVLFGQEIAPISARRDGVQQKRHCEILVRLKDEQGNIVPPMNFIPAAERYGLMPQVDRWVVQSFLRQYRSFFHSRDQQQSDRVFTINLSGASMSDDRFWQFLEAQLVSHPIDPKNLCFEITETAAIANLRKVTKFINKLKQLGCRFALDDFGSGMSSFTYLKTLPVDYLKIDGSFIKNITSNAIDRVMVESFIDISHTIGIQTIAEYVENRETIVELIDLGADFTQGHGISKPAPLEFHQPIVLLADPSNVTKS